MKTSLKLFTITSLVFYALFLVGCDEVDQQATSSAVNQLTVNESTNKAASQDVVQKQSTNSASIIFLHHSTGQNIWDGGVSSWFSNYNSNNGASYQISERNFPESDPYGWENYPYDYWNIWVNHAGSSTYLNEPTLEILTSQYDVIVFKHCFPVSSIEADTGSPDITSSDKRIENYKLQYNALKNKMKEFPNTKFIVWTGAALTQNSTSQAESGRAQTFFNWVKNDWDETGDNIFIWDFYQLETEGGLYLKDAYAEDPSDSHPNSSFSATVAPYLGRRITNVIKGDGDTTSLTGKDNKEEEETPEEPEEEDNQTTSSSREIIEAPASGCYAGMFPGWGDTEDAVNQETLENFENLSGKSVAIAPFSVFFGENKVTTRQLNRIGGYGAIPLVRLMPWGAPYWQPDYQAAYSFDRIIAGDFDQFLTNWANTIKDYGDPVMVTFAVEMNGDWFPWSGTYQGGEGTGPTKFGRAYRHIFNLFDAANADNVTWLFHANASSWPEESWNSIENYYPGDDYVDWIGISVYGAQTRTADWETFKKIMGPAYNTIAGEFPNKPLMLAEWGVGEFPGKGNKANWYTNALSKLQTDYSKIKMAIVYHEKWQNDDLSYSDLRINSSTEALAAFKNGISSDYFIGRISTSPAPLGITFMPASAGGPQVRIVDSQGSETSSFMAYSANLRGEFRSLEADIDGDNTNEIITYTAPGFGPDVRAFESNGTLISSFMAYDSNFRGGLKVTAGDYDNDGKLEIALAPEGIGGPNIRIYDLNNGSFVLKAGFFAYDQNFHGGTHLASGDFNGDGKDELAIAPISHGGPHVRIYQFNNGFELLGSFFAYHQDYHGGVQITIGDINGDNKDEIITAPFVDGGPDIKVYTYSNGQFNLLDSVMAYDSSYRGTLNMASNDADNNGRDEIILVPLTQGGPHVRIYQYANNDLTLLDDFMAYDAGFRGGVSLTALDIDNDSRAEIITAPFRGAPNVRVYNIENSAESLASWFWGFDQSFTGGVNFSE